MRNTQFFTKILLTVGCLLLSVAFTNAQSWTQVGADIDGEAAEDYSGMSVSLSSDGTIVAIGAPYNDGNGAQAGHVRVYENNAGTWTQLGGDIDGEADGNYSGKSVSLSSDGTILAIGAPNNDGSALISGHVRVYQLVDGPTPTWTQIGSDIDGEGDADYSGSSVSLNSDGTVVAIGAYLNDGNGSESGHVRVYQIVAGTWTQTGSDIDGEAAGDESGTSVSLNSDGTIVAIGAHYNRTGGNMFGHVRVFQNVAGTWTQMGSDIDGEAVGDDFGRSVSLSSDGSIVAIGANLNDGNGNASGHVQVYQYGGGGWSQVGNDIDGEAAGDHSGYSVSLSSDGSKLAIGAPNNEGTGLSSGHVRVYLFDGSTWIQIPGDIDAEATADQSGYSVSLSSDGSVVAIGAFYNDGNGQESGHVRVFNYPVTVCKTLPDFDTEVTPSEDVFNTDGPNTIFSDGCYIYKANLTVGKEYTFKTGCGDLATADFNTVIEVFKADGTTSITTNDNGCESNRSKVSWIATETSAFVRVRGYDGTETGEFTLAHKYSDPVPVACKTIPEFHTELTPVDATWLNDGPRLFASNGCYVYKVNCTVGKEYTFKTGCGDGAIAAFDTWIELYDANGIWIMENDDGCMPGWRSIVTWTATQSVAYVRVRGYNPSNFGLFTLAYQFDTPAPAVCKTIPDKDYTITPTTSWQTHPVQAIPGTSTETIEITSGACKIYEVSGITANTAYTFKTGCDDNASADFDTFIELYDAGGNWLAGNDDGCEQWTSILTWTAPGTYTGTVFIKVRGYNDEKTGDYRMAYIQGAVAPASSCKVPPLFDAVVTPSTTWAADSQTIGSDACYVYKVNTAIGNDYTFMTGCGPVGSVTPTATFDTWIDLYNADGTLIDHDDDGCPDQWRSKIEWTATGTLYFVKVRGWRPDSYGDYTVAYKYGAGPGPTSCPTPPDADETLSPAPTTSFQTGNADDDAVTSGGCYIYEVTVITGNTYTFKTGCGDGASAADDFDTFLELYDATGGWLAEDDDGCKVPASNDYTSKIVWTATYTGNAYIKVRGWNSEDYGAFVMAYTYVAIGPDAPSTGAGNDIAENMIKVYPNPANQSFIVASEKLLSFTRLTLSEFTGRVVRSWNLDQPAISFRIESTELAQGVYILSVETSEGWIRKKVSVVR